MQMLHRENLTRCAWTPYHPVFRLTKQSFLRTLPLFLKNSRKLELSISKNTPARKVGTRSRQCQPKIPGRFAFPGARNPRIYRISRFGQKSCRTKVSRIFRIFVPNFAPNFAPNFPRIFRGLFVHRFVGDGDQKKFTKNPRHFSM